MSPTVNIFDTFRQRAEIAPDARFAVFAKGGIERELSQGWMLGAAGTIAAGLAATGVKRGDIVVILLEHDPYLYAAFIGCILSGLVPTILPPLTTKQDPTLFREAMTVLFDRIKPAAVVTSPRAAPSVPPTSVTQINVDALPQPGDPVSPHQWDGVTGEGLAFLQHSSGTTNHKKGVMLSHAQVQSQVSMYAEALAICPGDTIVSWLPLYHDMGLITGLVMPAMLGCPVVSMDALEWVVRPAILLDAVETYHGAYVWLPNFAFHHICRADHAGRTRDLSTIKAIVNCSEPCRAATFDLFASHYQAMGLGRDKLMVSYAMAETVFAVTQTPAGTLARIGQGAQTAPYLSCGPVLPGGAIKIVASDGLPVVDGALGEICLRSASLFDGYWRLPEITAERMVDGWYHTHDLGRIEDGELFVVGRVDDLIIVNGKNLMAHELEDVVALVDGVAPGRAIVFDEFDAQLGVTRLIVLAELHDHVDPTAAAAGIRKAVFAACGIFPAATRIVPRGFLVKSTSGKLSRRASLEKFRAPA